MMYRLAACTVACMLCFTLIGCGDGPDLGEVTGKITMDGKPLPNAIVTFTPEAGGRPATGTTDDNGEYELAYIEGKGALLGKHKVAIRTAKKVEPSSASQMSSDDPNYGKQSSQSDYNNATVKEAIPAVYNTETKLTATVEKGDNEIDFALTSDGKIPSG